MKTTLMIYSWASARVQNFLTTLLMNWRGRRMSVTSVGNVTFVCVAGRKIAQRQLWRLK